MARLKNSGIRLVIPNGSLFENSVMFLKKAKYHFNFLDRSFGATVQENRIIRKLYRCRPMDVPQMIIDGDVDAGLTGKDWYLEWCYENGFKESKLKVVVELGYTRNSYKPIDIIVLCKKGSSVDPAVIRRKIKNGKKILGFNEELGIMDKKGIRIKAEYPNIARQFFKESKIIFSHGSSEANLLISKKNHYCVVGKDSGATIKQNDKLKVVHVLLQSPVVLLTRKSSKEILKLGQQLKSAYIAESLRLIEFNVANEARVEKSLEILKSFGYTTANVIDIVEKIGFSIRVGVKESDIEDLANELLEIGADFLIVTKPEQVFMK